MLHEVVRQVRRGLRRTLRMAPVRQARALSVGDIGRSTPRGARDAALILLGFASALRRSELVALTLADLDAKPAGLLLTVGRVQDGPGPPWAGRRCRPRPPPRHRFRRRSRILARRPRHRARAAVHQPARPRRLEPDHRRHGRPGPQDPRRGRRPAQRPDQRNSLRAGHVTSAAMAGVGVDQIAAQTRHRRIDVLIEHYIRPVEALRTTSSRDLGL